MRRIRWTSFGTVGAVLAGVIAVGCGGDESPVPTTAAPSSTIATGEADDVDVYELDVIAEAEPDEGAPPLTVQFLGYIEEDEGGPWVFRWEFGDGASSTEQNPVHTYTDLGDYTATLTVTDQAKNSGTDEIDVFVETDDY